MSRARKKIDATIFVYRSGPDQAPTMLPVEKGFKAEIASYLPYCDDIVSDIFPTRKEAINDVIDKFCLAGYYGTLTVWHDRTGKGKKEPHDDSSH